MISMQSISALFFGEKFEFVLNIRKKIDDFDNEELNGLLDISIYSSFTLIFG